MNASNILLPGIFAFLAAATLSQNASAAAGALDADWVHGTQSLPTSHGTYTVPTGTRMLVGTKAAAYDNELNGTKDSDSEGIIETPQRLLYLTYDASGYVTADDWKDVDATKMLSDMKSATADANKDREANGSHAIYVDDWVQKPSYDVDTKRVRWIVGLHEASGGRFINAVALVLGRHGYEKFILASKGTDPAGDRAALDTLTSHYTFDVGSRFSDYVKGDKLAGYGLAALVATGAGITLAKTGLLAAILLFAKKFIVIIIALAAGGFSRIRKFFTRGSGTKFGPPTP